MPRRIRVKWREFAVLSLWGVLIGAVAVNVVEGHAEPDDMTCHHVTRTAATFTCTVTK